MATSAPAITSPPGYTLEQPTPTASATLPPGYAIEGSTQAAPPVPTLSRVPSASEMPTFGEPGINTPTQRLTMPIVKALMMAHEKLQEVAAMNSDNKLAPEHPIQAKIGDVLDNIEELLLGGQSHIIAPGKPMGTSSGVLNNPVSAAILPGGEAEPALASGLREGSSLLKGATGAFRSLLKGATGAFRGGEATGEAAEEAPGIVKQIIKGKDVAQGPAKAAIRTAAGAEEETPLLQGHKTVLDEPLSKIAAQEKSAYAKQDEAAGFDVKETRRKLSDAEYKVKQPEIDDATRARLEKTISESKKRIADAEKKMSDAGVDVKAADTLHKQRMAGEEFKGVLGSSLSPDGQSVNVDRLLNASKKLRLSKRGDRLEQFMGKEGADAYMAELQHAQEIGAHALKVQRIAKLVGKYVGVLGVGEELIRRSVR